MMDFSSAKIKNLIIHEIGNKARDEKLFLSSNLQEINEELEQVLLNYFHRPFKFNLNKELYNFYHNSSLNLNEVYSYAKNTFSENSEEAFIRNSKNIAMHLYEFTDHPKITRGELIVAEISEVGYENDIISILGIFKSENKEAFIKVLKGSDKINLQDDRGINISKIEKACIIMNRTEEDGFTVLNADNMSQATDYWTNKFLHIREIRNSSHKTKEIMKICKVFNDEVLATKDDNEDEFAFTNDYVNYMEDNEAYDMNSFTETVFKSDDMKKKFLDFHEENKESFDINLEDSFTVSPYDVKKQKRKIKNIIKLDTNLELKVLLDKEDNSKNIEKGFDQSRGMSYYKVYFNKELEE